MMDSEKLRVRFGGYQGPHSIHTRAARHFGKELLKNAGTEIVFELEESIFDRGLKSGDLIKLVASGDLDICYISTVRCSESVPELAIFELPFLFKDRARVFSALNGELGTYFRNRLEQVTPFKLLGFWDNGFRHISNSVRPIQTPEDCKGLTIRTQMSNLHAEVFRSFGFSPVATDIKDFLDTIGENHFQAQDNPLTSISIFEIYKHHRFITLSAHFFGVSLLLCNRQTFETWPDSVQKLVMEAADKATFLQRKLAVEEDKTALATLRSEGCQILKITSGERVRFEQAVSKLNETYRKKFGPEIFDLLRA